MCRILLFLYWLKNWLSYRLRKIFFITVIRKDYKERRGYKLPRIKQCSTGLLSIRSTFKYPFEYNKVTDFLISQVSCELGSSLVNNVTNFLPNWCSETGYLVSALFINWCFARAGFSDYLAKCDGNHFLQHLFPRSNSDSNLCIKVIINEAYLFCIYYLICRKGNGFVMLLK